MERRYLVENRAVTVSVLAARPAIHELERRGIDPGPAFGPAHLLQALDGRLSRKAVRELWQSAAIAALDPAFGAHVAENLPEGSFDLLDYLIATADTVGDSLTALARHARLLDDDSEWQLVTLGQSARLSRRVAVTAPQLDEHELAWLLVRSRQATGIRWSPESVAFQHEGSDDSRALARVFGCPVTFGASASEMRFASTLLSQPHARADRKLFAILARCADAQLASLPSTTDIAALVTATIARQMASALPDLPSTAAAVHLPERTLQRRLAEKGLTHSALIDDVRRGLALQYLAETGLTMAEIAQRLNFSDATAFHRAFRRWTGAAPSGFRRRLREESRGQLLQSAS